MEANLNAPSTFCVTAWFFSKETIWTNCLSFEAVISYFFNLETLQQTEHKCSMHNYKKKWEKTQDLFLQKFCKLKSYPFTFPRKSKSASNGLSYESSLAKSVKIEKLLTTWWYRVYSTAPTFGHSIMYPWSLIHHQLLMWPPFSDLLVRILHYTLSPAFDSWWYLLFSLVFYKHWQKQQFNTQVWWFSQMNRRMTQTAACARDQVVMKIEKLRARKTFAGINQDYLCKEYEFVEQWQPRHSTLTRPRLCLVQQMTYILRLFTRCLNSHNFCY